jgi:membrane protein
MTLRSRIKVASERFQRLKIARVVAHYFARNGPLLSAGLSYQAIFAVFAAVWVLFAVAGFIIRGNPALLAAIVSALSRAVPGLIDTGSGGAISVDSLLQVGVLGITGAIAAVGLVFTALGWLASGRDAVRSMFKLSTAPVNFFLLKARDLGLATGFGLVMILSAVLGVFSTTALGAVLTWLGISPDSEFATIVARVVGLGLALVLDTVVVATFYRVVSAIRIPLRILWQGALGAAVGLGVLKALGASLLSGASRNPLLASFAAIIGLLIWFNLVCQLILLGAAWVSVTATDRSVTLGGARKRQPRTSSASRGR